MDYVRTNKAPAPLGPYEQAVIHNGTVYVSMQVPVHADGNDTSILDIGEQAELILDNIEAILESAGSAMNKTLKVMIYLTDIHDGKKVNAVYEKYFEEHKPARGVIQVAGLPLGYQIAMDVIAAVD